MDLYFKRIGYQNTPKPDLKTLTELHWLHVNSIPFENLTPWLADEVSLDPVSLSDKLIKGKRGGYCFEHNHIFTEVLKNIGFKVKGLGARVLWNQPEDLITRRSHMLLLVEIDGVHYLADVGFGGLTLTTPIIFEIGLEQKTTHELFRIGRIGEDYKLQAKVEGNWKTLYRFDLQEQFPIDYEVANYYVSTHPASIFRNNIIIARPVDDGRLALSNDVFTFYPKNGPAERKTVTSVSELKNILTEKFKLNIEGVKGLDQRLEAFFKKPKDS